ncbi:MAG: tRNA-dihydrouridine synthase family protein [Bacteroidales bacterium]|nr:tRNA-dihydrouridine synthase family protein [Bacteroidales bacterium]
MPLIFAAPLQGYTDAPYRRAHAETFGGIDEYYTPFVRIEHGQIRPHDIRDIISPLNSGLRVVPQIICRDAGELALLRDAVAAAGFHHIDVNMGCPFVPQVRRGRGAGLLAHRDSVFGIARVMAADPEIKYSVKMRLGVERPDEWHETVAALDDVPLRHICVHPRTARQQYRGDLYIDQYQAIKAASRHKIVFNGDIRTIADARRLSDEYALMIGRGLLARPSLAAELSDGNMMSDDRLRAGVLEMHRRLYEHYRSILCGDTQILSKLKTFWDYADETLWGRKMLKSIRKSTGIVNYMDIVNSNLKI